MSIFEYDEEKHMRTVRSEGYEDGLEDGIERGIERGVERGIERGIKQKEYQVISRMLRENLSEETISKYTGCSVERVNQIKNEMLVES